jgi:hypothetical protein
LPKHPGRSQKARQQARQELQTPFCQAVLAEGLANMIAWRFFFLEFPEGTATSAAGTSNPILPSRSYRRASKQGRTVIFLNNCDSKFLLNKQVKTA